LGSARSLLWGGMAHDEEHTQHSEHIVEVPPRTRSMRAATRRSIASLSVALCLAIAGLAIAVGIVRGQRATADERTREAVQREELKDGWGTLSALAAQHSPSISAPAAPQPTERNVVIVNVPPPVATSPAVVAPTVATPAPAQATLPVPASTMSTAQSAPVAVSTPAAPQGSNNAQAPSPAAPATSGVSQTLNAVPCGPNTCNTGLVCCNPSCGTCVAPGATCDTSLCSNPITYPASQSCGLTTCTIDSVCCNPSCGICTAPGESCSQRACG
jgi:hypothetical protein